MKTKKAKGAVKCPDRNWAFDGAFCLLLLFCFLGIWDLGFGVSGFVAVPPPMGLCGE
jgi:hypothetical protein